MSGDVATALLRSVVAATFLLSAVWKLRHASDFATVVRVRATWFYRIARRALWVVPVAELALATVLFARGAVGQIASAAAAVVLIGMSTSFVGGKRNDDGLGCGCWSPAAGSHHTDYLLRNTLLVLMSLIGIAGGSISIGASLFGASAGLLVAVLIMELPLIRSVVRDINTGGQIA